MILVLSILTRVQFLLIAKSILIREISESTYLLAVNSAVADSVTETDADICILD